MVVTLSRGVVLLLLLEGRRRGRAARHAAARRAVAGGRPEASLEFNVFGQIIDDSMGFSTLV